MARAHYFHSVIKSKRQQKKRKKRILAMHIEIPCSVSLSSLCLALFTAHILILMHISAMQKCSVKVVINHNYFRFIWRRRRSQRQTEFAEEIIVEMEQLKLDIESNVIQSEKCVCCQQSVNGRNDLARCDFQRFQNFYGHISLRSLRSTKQA